MTTETHVEVLPLADKWVVRVREIRVGLFRDKAKVMGFLSVNDGSSLKDYHQFHLWSSVESVTNYCLHADQTSAQKTKDNYCRYLDALEMLGRGE